ncbi:ATP-binding protein [Streptomyces griseoloalbus]|uniref:ATP-binding protein n=1 Tax=Streptomyces griseoloalbus TaxID=67303 RepID=UPI0033B6F24D
MRGAHGARPAAERWLAAQQVRPEAAAVDADTATASLIIAELTADAALHGRVQGRDACLALTFTPTTLRIEVTDAQGDRLPVRPREADADGECGRGLLLVTALADTWGCEPHHPGGKTVWAECGRRGAGTQRQEARGPGHSSRGEDGEERCSVRS